MEATAKFDFQATSADEISFKKGMKLKVLNKEEDKSWYKAEISGKDGLVPSNYIEMKPTPWYLGPITRVEAETMLLERNDSGYNQRDGAFLVRPSERTPGDFSISVKYGSSVQHFKVLRAAGGKYYLWTVQFDSLNDLIKYHKTASISQAQTIYLQEMTRSKVIASYDFRPENAEEELELHRGDIVVIVNKNDPNWWLGEITRGSQVLRGLFPKTYVTPYTD